MCICQGTFNGDHVIVWIADAFNDCIYTWLDVASFVFGWCSIFTWCICLLPQMWMNYKAKRVDGISSCFILEWVLGDATNLAGCIFTNALPTQTYLAMYFVATDFGLLGQWLWYKKRWRRFDTSVYDDGKFGSLNTDILDFEQTRAMISISSTSRNSGIPPWTPDTNSKGSRNFLNYHLLTLVACCCLTCRVNAAGHSPGCQDKSWSTLKSEYVGTIFAWVSNAIYFCSRFPQILKNYRGRSTRGISLGIFCLTILSNTFYGLSILFREPSINMDFYRNKLPFLIGSIGTFVFDIIIFIQFIVYRRASFPSLSVYAE